MKIKQRFFRTIPTIIVIIVVIIFICFMLCWRIKCDDDDDDDDDDDWLIGKELLELSLNVTVIQYIWPIQSTNWKLCNTRGLLILTSFC